MPVLVFAGVRARAPLSFDVSAQLFSGHAKVEIIATCFAAFRRLASCFFAVNAPVFRAWSFCCFAVSHHGSQFLRSCFVVLFRIVSHYEKHTSTAIANNRFKQTAEIPVHFVVAGVRRSRLT
ncbi:MAG: hypothetical protein Q8N96_04810 [Methylovulum sp.]|nr:hypothetical protein [Methylovulum sp.]